MLPPPAPVVVVEQDGGGLVYDFAARIAEYRRRHTRVVVRGECDSSCTMVLGLRHVCAEATASFGFHRAFMRYPDRPFDMSEPVPAATAVLMQHYPKPVRAWIAAHGGLTSELLTLSGMEMRAVVPACR